MDFASIVFVDITLGLTMEAPGGVLAVPGVPDDVPGMLEWCAWCAKRYAWRLRWTEIERWRWLDIGVDIPRTC